MPPLKPSFFYTAYGLTIKSELALPELRSIQPVSNANITISPAEPSDAFNRENLNRNYWRATAHGFYMHIEDIGTDFHVTNGNRIIIETAADTSDFNIHLYLNSCMGVLVQQKNILPLHASCISKGTECIIISGQSGSGKSTLAMALNKKGYPLLSDDICALHFSQENPPFVYPSIPQIKIGADSANALKINTSNLNSTPSKHIVPIDNRSAERRHIIKAIFSIEQSDNDQFKIRDLHGSQKMAILIKNTYAPTELIANLGKSKIHFDHCSILAKLYKVKQIYRTSSLNNLPDLISIIENEFSNE